MLHATFKLTNVSEWENDKGQKYYKLIYLSSYYSKKADSNIEQVEEISIPQRFEWQVPEFKKHIGKEITVQVTPRTYFKNGVNEFQGFKLESDKFQISDTVKP